MKEFLKETFRPNTEAEQQAINRHFRQRAVVSLFSVVILLVVAAIILIPIYHSSAQFSGTWVAYNDHADGFHKDDTVLEFKDNTFYINGSRYGSLVHRNGQTAIPAHSAAGSFDRYVTVNGNILTIEYELPRSAYVTIGDDSISSFGSSIDPSSTAWVASIVAQQNADSESRRRLDTYVRVSEACGLTDEQLDELY